MNTTQIGAWAEDIAWQHMQQHGWQLVERNFFCKGGELDIIARKDNVLAFVEVKYRKHHTMGGAVASLSKAKQRHLIHSAKVFLQRYPLFNNMDCRFDLVAISGSNSPHSQVQIQWLDNAFIT
ncbi:MAG: YraN family protein [Gammaproteobacteria bacterium]|nr:YraN family protein [Gammaproteobacteria bacterium]